MIDAILAILVIAMVPFAITSAVILLFAARQQPRIGVLTERTFIGADICVMLVSGALITINRLIGYSLFPIEIARIVFSTSLILLGLVPIWWVRLWRKGRLG